MQYPLTKKQHFVKLWLWIGAGLILLMLVIGGITRLTGSGLSMTDWNLLMGAIPPTDHSGWMEAFNQYKQFPEYQQLNTGMELSEFKQIYFWEYFHRLLGRLIGLVFLVPFLWFWNRGYFNKNQLKKLSLLFLLGAIQGGMGWVMVRSGLADIPYVSHYRLAIHLVLAFILFGFCVWLALDIYHRKREKPPESVESPRFLAWMYGIAGILFIQIIWGGFVAGLKAGFIYNTFPLMNDKLMPVKAWALEPWLLNLFENPGMVQWSHRIIGTLLVLTVILFWIRVFMRSVNRITLHKTFALLMLVIVQYVLGVFTLVYNVPVALGVFHQLTALLVWGSWVVLYHQLKRTR